MDPSCRFQAYFYHAVPLHPGIKFATLQDAAVSSFYDCCVFRLSGPKAVSIRLGKNALVSSLPSRTLTNLLLSQTDVLQRETEYSVQDLLPCAQELYAIYQGQATDKCDAVRRKYASARFLKVSKQLKHTTLPSQADTQGGVAVQPVRL